MLYQVWGTAPEKEPEKADVVPLKPKPRFEIAFKRFDAWLIDAEGAESPMRSRLIVSQEVLIGSEVVLWTSHSLPSGTVVSLRMVDNHGQSRFLTARVVGCEFAAHTGRILSDASYRYKATLQPIGVQVRKAA